MSDFIQQQFSLDGQVAVVTGGTGVLGSAMAKGLARAGATVYIMGRRAEAAQEVVDIIVAEGGKGYVLPADVTDEAALRTAEETIRQQSGRVDILVNGAGGNRPDATLTPDQNFFDFQVDGLRKVVELNLFGSILPTLILCQSWREQRAGVVINVSSMASVQAITRVLGYSVAKAAIDNYTRWLATDLALKYGDGIRVNAIAPGFFLTEQNRKLLTNEDGSYTQRSQQILANTPMRRFGQPDELIGTLIYLCSPAARFVTGAVIPVDGGFSIYSGV